MSAGTLAASSSDTAGAAGPAAAPFEDGRFCRYEDIHRILREDLPAQTPRQVLRPSRDAAV